MKAVALIGDIVDSRKAIDRAALDERFVRAVDRVVRVTLPGRKADPVITRGEEVEAVYCDAKGLLRDCWRLTAGLYPSRIRFAFGVGMITTGADSDNPLKMDGPAFHAARALFPKMRSDKTDLMLGSNDKVEFEHENDLLKLLSHQTRQWKPSRWSVWEQFDPEIPIARFTASTGLKPGSVYKNVNDGLMPTIASLCEWVENSINRKLETHTWSNS